MFWIGYRIFVLSLEWAIRILSVWDRKSKNFLIGRKDQKAKLSSWLGANDQSVIQIHCASLGEYELSLPLYKTLKQHYPAYKFLFSFFSPSGFEHAKIPSGSQKCYLPIDRRKKVKSFLDIINPEMVIFIKYEYWFQYLKELNERNIPFGYVNVNQQEYPFNLKFKEAKKIINQAAFIFTSNEKTTKDLIANGLKVDDQFLDLRYIKSKELLAEHFVLNSSIKKFFDRDNLIICGSVWKEDIAILKPSIKGSKNFNWVLAPHNVDNATLTAIKNEFSNVSIFSKKEIKQESRILLIDTIGDLKYLYRYGRLNYIGGAFNTGLHNVLEPISAGAPIVFGPEYKAYPEAVQLVNNKKGFSISNAKEFADIIEKLEKGSLHLNSTNWLKNLNAGLQNMTNQIGSHL